jgi:hypothetical protein
VRSGLLRSLAGLIVVAAALASRSPETRADEPLVMSPAVMADFAQYKSRRSPMYFAVSTDGLFSWYSYCIDYNCQAGQSERRTAVAECKKEGGADCVIFAVGSDVQVQYRVGDPATMAPATTTPCVIDTFVPGSVAGAIVASLRPGACTDFRRFGYYDDSKAFATSDLAKFQIARGWSFRYGSPEEAIKAAMGQCEASKKSLAVSDPCELFALGDIVVRGRVPAARRRRDLQEEQGRDERRSAAALTRRAAQFEFSRSRSVASSR